MEQDYLEVYFNKYCDTCKHHDLDEAWDPCNDCLAEPMNVNSHKPVYWEESDEPKKAAPKPEPEPTPDPTPTVKNLFDENGSYGNDVITYSVENHISRYESSKLKTVGTFSEPLVVFSPGEVSGKTFYTKAVSNEVGGTQGLTLARYVVVGVAANGRETVIGDISIAGVNDFTFPEDLDYSKWTEIDLKLKIYSTSNGSSDGYSYVATDRLTVTWDELTDESEWVPYI